MASSTLSLKKLRDSSTLKSEISQLQEEKQELQARLEREQKLVKKLESDLIEQKKDFEHLEKQFNHFADIEADYEALQQEVQVERLENMVEKEKQETQARNQVKKAREEAKELQKELKELKKLDPLRLKRQVTDLKKKSSTQAGENKTLNNALVSARKELKEATAEKERLANELRATFNESNPFWSSDDGEWALYETGLLLDGESAPEDGERPKRIRCLNLKNGMSVVSRELSPDGTADWHGELDIPQQVSKEAGKRLKKIASENEEEA